MRRARSASGNVSPPGRGSAPASRPRRGPVAWAAVVAALSLAACGSTSDTGTIDVSDDPSVYLTPAAFSGGVRCTGEPDDEMQSYVATLIDQEDQTKTFSSPPIDCPWGVGFNSVVEKSCVEADGKTPRACYLMSVAGYTEHADALFPKLGGASGKPEMLKLDPADPRKKVDAAPRWKTAEKCPPADDPAAPDALRRFSVPDGPRVIAPVDLCPLVDTTPAPLP